MGRFLAHRLLGAALVLLGVSVAAFLLVHLSGDPAALLVPPDATQEEVDEMRARLGLDQPLYQQYGRFALRLLQGDLGHSFRSKHAITELIAARFPATLHLTVASLGFALLLALPIGVFSALKRGTAFDAAARGLILLGQSAPVFWTGLLSILIFAVQWQVLPPSGYESWRGLVLPTVTLGLHSAAELARFVRGSMLDSLMEDYVRTARSKGLGQPVVIWKHVLRNALIPVVTVVGLRFGVLMGGAAVTETIFNWPGMGNLIVEAVSNRDVPLVQAGLMVTACFVTLSSLVVDFTYVVIDPRITYS